MHFKKRFILFIFKFPTGPFKRARDSKFPQITREHHTRERITFRNPDFL